ncbi:MAG: cation:proton antiporter [Polyangiaceae bacterium]|nr:cation:proton antiporter [Polyangiaceae bacterium]MCL4753957.1 cation:proton antiporter [Myxococcales bacterium]
MAQAALIVVVSRALGVFTRWLGQPMVIAEISAGILLGPSLVGWLWPGFTSAVFPTQSLPLLGLASQVGLLLFMFLIGIELDPKLLRGRANASMLGGGLAVPHLVVEGARPSAVVVTLRRPVPCDTPDAEPVRLLVAHVHPGGRGHTRLIARLARLARLDTTRALAGERDARRLVRELLARLG